MSIYGIREIINGQEPLKVVVVADDGVPQLEKITEYGVRFVVGQQSSVGERVKRVKGVMTVGEATGLVHNVGSGNVQVNNSFDNLYPFRRKKVEIDGNWFEEFPLNYVKDEIVDENGTQYHYLWVCASKVDKDYRIHEVFERGDGTYRSFTYVSNYEGFIDTNGKLRSIPGVFPTINTNAADFLTAARLNDGLGVDSKYVIQDLMEIDYLQHIVQIQFATKHSQSKLVGATNLPYSANHLTVGNQVETNEFVLTNAQAEEYVVGQTIVIGTSLGSSNRLSDRIVTNIELDTPIIGNATITFDGEPATIDENLVVSTRAWKTGMLDDTLASDGYYEANTSKYPIKINGIENLYGNIYKHIVGLKIKGDEYWVTKDLSKYNQGDNTEGYFKLSYKVPMSSDYVKALGRDNMFPFAKLSVEVGGGSAIYYADYFYQNYEEGAYRGARFGGSWDSGVYAGMFFWLVHRTLGYTSIGYGARLSYRP